MKKRKSAIILIILILVLVFCVVMQNKETMTTAIRKTFFKATTVATGTTGTCNWTLDSDGLLLIEPTNGVSGTMDEQTNNSFVSYSDQIISIQFNAIVYAPADSSSLFYNYTALTTFDSTNFNTENATTMVNMFSNCSSLTNLDLSNFDTQNVISMNRMFCNCISLIILDLSSFNTTNVTSMNYMFYNCGSLVS